MNHTAGQWRRIVVAFLVTLALLTVFCSVRIAAASTLADGEYTVDFEILKGDPKDDSTSLANGYWNKPAALIVKNGVITVRTVINKDAWVIEFTTKQGSSFVDAKVISRDTANDSRIVEFGISSLEQDVVTSMTVDIPSINYYHSYEARFRFSPDTLKLVKAADSDTKEKPQDTVKQTEPPAVSDNSSKPKETATSAATAKPDATAKPSDNGSSQKGSAVTNEAMEGAKDQASSNGTTGTAAGGSTSSGTSTASEGKADSSTGSTENSSSPATAESEDASADFSAANEEPALQGTAASEAEASNDASVASNNESSVEESAQLTEDGEAVTASSAADHNEQEVEEGSTTLVIMLIVIASLFVIGSIIWIVRKGKSNKK